MNKRLYRSNSNRVLGGVCGGIGDYLDIDPIFVRIFFILFLIAQGFGFLVYVILWIILPRQDQPEATEGKLFEAGEFSNRAKEMGEELQQAVHTPNPEKVKFIGIALVAAGGFLFLKNLDIVWLNWLNSNVVWSLALIAAGVLFLYRALNN